MARATVVWNGRAAMSSVERTLQRKIDASAISLQTFLRKKLGRDQTKKRVGRRWRGLNPSRPGAYPKRVTGQLQRSISWEAGKLKARIGTNLKYGRWLETGTRKMARRPWLSKGFREHKGKMRRILA